MGLFPYLSVGTMTTFPSTSLIIKKVNWAGQARKFSFALCLGQTFQV